MASELFEIEDRCAELRQLIQNVALRTSGLAAYHAKAVSQGEYEQISDDRAPVCLVSALQAHRAPANAPQNFTHCIGAPAAAPAIHQWTPIQWPIVESVLHVLGDIARNKSRTDALGCKCGLLFVDGTNSRALFVAEHWIVQSPRIVIQRKFRRRTNIDDLVKVAELCYGCYLLETHCARRK